MLHLVTELYEENYEHANETIISDLINYLGQMLDGDNLSEANVSSLQQIGLRALNKYPDPNV